MRKRLRSILGRLPVEELLPSTRRPKARVVKLIMDHFIF